MRRNSTIESHKSSYKNGKQKDSAKQFKSRMDPELEKSINRKLQRQNELNMRVENLNFENDQSLISHAKFKQMIGYRDRKINRNGKKQLDNDFSTDLVSVKLPTDVDDSPD